MKTHLKNNPALFIVFILILSIFFIDNVIFAQIQEQDIVEIISGKLPEERATIKGQEIAKVVTIGKVKRLSFDIEIVEVEPIDSGVQIFARVWGKDGKQIGFGVDGSVDIERFKIINPSILVPDEEGNIVREFKDPITGEIKQNRFREDLKEALFQSLEQTISVKKEKFSDSKIIYGKRGNTTSTFYPSVDGRIYNTNSDWDSARSSASGTAQEGTNSNDIGTENNGGGSKTIERGFFLFNTSGISDIDNVSSATFSVVGSGKANIDDDGDDYMVVVVTSPNSTSSLSGADYDQIKGVDGNFPLSSGVDMQEQSSTIDLGSIVVDSSTYNNFTLNSNGISNISKTGFTNLGLVEGHDSLNNDLSDSTSGNHFTVLFADNTDTTVDPKLVVEHTESNVAPSAATSLFVEGQTNPSEVVDSTPEFSAIYNDLNSTDEATHYRIQVSTASNFSSIYWDSGTTTMATTTQGNRSSELSYGGSALATTTTYYWRIKFSDDDGAEGAWSTETATFVIVDEENLKVRKSFNESVQNSTTLQNDDSLALVLASNKTYILDGVIFVSSTSATPDIKIGFSAPSGSILTISYTNDQSRGFLSAGDTSPSIPIPGSSTIIPVHFSGTIAVSGTPGDVILRWSQNSSNNNPTTIHIGSYIRAEEI